MSAIVADGVTRRFGPVTAVDDVSLEVRAGEVIGLIGANGAGKTTLIRMLLGLLEPHAGRVLLAGLPPSRRTRRRVGYVPQGLGLWPDLTVAEHLGLAAAAYGTWARSPDDEEVDRAADRLVAHLPLGLRRRVAFELALAHRPDVLVLDEPTSGVDALARARLWEVIGRTARDGAGVLVSTHHLDEASRCDRIALLADGRLIAGGSTDELTDGRTAVRVVTPRWQAAWTRLEKAGLPVLPAGRALRIPGADPGQVAELVADDAAEVVTVPATLEEVFLTEVAA